MLDCSWIVIISQEKVTPTPVLSPTTAPTAAPTVGTAAMSVTFDATSLDDDVNLTGLNADQPVWIW